MLNISLYLVSGPPNNNSYFFEKTIFKNHIKPFWPCGSINRMHVLVDGQVTACCGELSGDLIFGSILKNSPIELFNNEKIIDLYNHHMNNTIPPNISCNSCFGTDPIICELWSFFYKTLVLIHQKNWDIEIMQNKFDKFFNLFQDKIPSEVEYASLFTNLR